MNRVEGKKGEDLALEFLLKRGLELRERNWRCGHLEIDLIMEDEKFVHIVEVRSRTVPYLVSPAESVATQKQRRIFRAAASYARRHYIRKEIIFDIVSITYEGENYDLEFLEGVLIPFYI